MATSDKLIKLYFISNYDDLAYGLFKMTPELITEEPYTPGNDEICEILEIASGGGIFEYRHRNYHGIMETNASGESFYFKYTCKNYYLAFSYENPGVAIQVSTDAIGRSNYVSELDISRDVIDKLLEQEIIEDIGVSGYVINVDYVEKNLAKE